MPAQIMWEMDGRAQYLDVDALLRVNEKHEAKLTEHPIETGSVISDHTIMAPMCVEMEGLISDTPLGFSVKGLILAGLASVGSQAMPGGALAQGFMTSFAGAVMPAGTDTPSANAKAVLRAIHAARVPVGIARGAGVGTGSGPSDVFSDMILEHLEIPEDEKTGEAIRFFAAFKELRTVASETVPIPDSYKPGAQKLERQPTQKIPDGSKPDSAARALAKKLGYQPKGP